MAEVPSHELLVRWRDNDAKLALDRQLPSAGVSDDPNVEKARGVLGDLVEARDAAGREFGATRLVELIRGNRHAGARDLVDAIFAALDAFRGETPPHDDMTAVALRITD